MKKPRKILNYWPLIIFVQSLNPFSTYAQNSTNAILKSTSNLGDTAIIVEAESGKLGSGFSVLQDGAINYITPKANYTGQSGPGDTSRMIIYQITFKDSGNYNLFAHVYVGSGGFNDDSFFAGTGFGEKNDTLASDWIMVNGLAGVGFTGPTDVVDAAGTAGSQVWKWVNITKSFFPDKNAFGVSIGNLTKTFQIGSREDGLNIDKFAFGKSYLYFTVDILDKGLAGSITIPTIDSSKYYKGPPLAQGFSKFLGNVMGSDKIFANYWNQITPGNEGKWGSIGSSSDTTQWNWSGLDGIYTYARNHHILFKEHTLIWGSQQPSWMSTLDQAQQVQYIESWIRQVGHRYSNIDLCDVVNEALPGHNPPDGENGRANYKNALGGDGTTGWDWVIKAFQLARKYLPNTKLLINDYGIINNDNATTSYLTIINLLKSNGLIDGIGVQGHRFELESADLTTVKNNLDRLAATGLPIYITEMDLGNLNNTGTPDDNQQLQLYQQIFPVLWSHPGVKGITLWGYVVGEMWQSSCYLVLNDGTWRPALTWIAQYVKNNTPSGVEEIVNTLPSGIKIEQNYPNPFSTSTKITFSITSYTKVCLKIYNNLGLELATLVNENLNAGNYAVSWNALDIKLESGIYYYKLFVGNNVIGKKMVLIK